MKYIPLYAAGLALLLSALAIFYSKNSSDLVYVDVNKLIEGYTRTKQVKSEFEKKSSSMKAEVDTLLSNWQKEIQQYEKERSQMSPTEVKLKQELLGTKQQQIGAYQQSIDQKVREEETKSRQTLINDVNDYVLEYGKTHHYKIIFGASGSGNIMYAAESTDLTDDILKGLNAQYAKK